MLYHGNDQTFVSIDEHRISLTPIIGQNGFYYVDTSFYVTVPMRGMWVQIIIPKGFITDLISGPTKLKRTLGIKHRDHMIAAIVHDYLYSKRMIHITDTNTFKCSRVEADQAMCHLMLFEGKASRDVIDIIYAYLRRWAWVAWWWHRLKNILGLS